MRLLNKVYDLLSRIKFSNVPLQFISRDDLFQLTFDENWVYSKKGNSFYSFHNLKDDLKGGLQFSINWYVNPPESMDEKEALLYFVCASENGKVDFQSTMISDHYAIHYRKKYADSNMIFYYWYIYNEKILTIITFIIFEEESDDVKSKWMKRVTGIINSLKLNAKKFQTTPMK